MLLVDEVSNPVYDVDDAISRLLKSSGGPDNHPSLNLFRAKSEIAYQFANFFTQQTVKFVFDEKATQLANEASLSRPTSMLAALKELRLPYESMWIEFPALVRHKHLESLRTRGKYEGLVPTKYGFLINQTNDNATQFDVFIVWSSIDDEGTEFLLPYSVSELVVKVDLEHIPVSSLELTDEIEQSTSGHVNLWKEQDEELKALECLSQYFVTDVPVCFEGALSKVPDSFREKMLAEAYKMIGGDGYFLLAILLLIQADDVMSYEKVDRTKINKHRSKKGKSLLNDHYTVTLSFDNSEGNFHGGLSGGGVQRRAHLVRGHFVTRASTIYWRRSHIRGAGKVSSKTVSVKG